jgi:serine/threonine protein kinase
MTPERWRQVDDLFQQAADLPPEQRRAFLEQACGNDADLRREVDLLLAHDASTTAPALESALKSGLNAWANQGRDLIGQLVGPYRILKPIGRGGMGAVFLAVRDDDQFEKHVAIKLVRSDMDTAVILQRFKQERQILANLQHAHIAQLLDGGVTRDGLPYFAMEHIDGGKPITEYAKANRLSVPARLELFRQVCAAVQYAHQNLIVHRDLKPSNILVTPAGAVKLLDFGVAKVLEASPLEGPAITSTGMMMITPEYASPEQVRGEPVSTASDVYMLGAVLFELLTGEQAHKLKDYSPAHIAEAVCQTETERPSEVVARSEPSLRRSLEGDLDNIVLTALRKERERRYPSVEALSEDIRRHLDGRPVSARQDTLWYLAGKFIRRNRISVAAAALVLISLLAGISVALVEARRAEHRFLQVRKLASTFLFSFHDKIENLQGATEAREFVVKTALEYLDSLASEAGNDIALNQELANAYLRVAQVQGDPRRPNLGHTDAALASLAKASQIAQSMLRKDPSSREALRVLAAAGLQEGDMRTARGDSRKGAQAQRHAVAAAEQLCRRPDAGKEDLRVLNDALLRLGDTTLDEKPADSLATYQRALAVARQLGSKPVLAQTYQRIGRVSHELGDPESGIRNYQEAEKLTAELSAAEPQNARLLRELMVIYNFLGNYSGHPAYFNLGRPKEALAYYRKAENLQKRLMTGDARDVRARMDRSIGAAKLAEVLIPLNPHDAVRQGQICLDNIQPLVDSTQSFRYLRIRHNCLSAFGRALAASGKTDGAIRILHQAVDLAESLWKDNPDDLGARAGRESALFELGEAYLAAKQWDAAETQLRRSLQLLEKERREYPSDLYFLRDFATVQEDLAKVMAGRGNRSQAAEWYRRAIASWEQWQTLSKHSSYANAQLTRVHVAQALLPAASPLLGTPLPPKHRKNL